MDGVIVNYIIKLIKKGTFYISRYLNKYVGKYRVVAAYDLATNDFPRDKNGVIDQSFDDIYITCQGNATIYHYGGKILEATIPSVGRGKNVIKNFYTIKTGNDLKEFTENDNIDFDKLEKKMLELKLITELTIADGEVYFKFYDKDIDIVAELMKARTSGANIKPFSNKNLPKIKYQIPLTEIAKYKAVTEDIPKGELLVISRVTNRFLTDILRKKAKVFDINADMKLKMLKGKEYIYDMGYFEEYLEYLKKNLKEIIK